MILQLDIDVSFSLGTSEMILSSFRCYPAYLIYHYHDVLFKNS